MVLIITAHILSLEHSQLILLLQNSLLITFLQQQVTCNALQPNSTSLFMILHIRSIVSNIKVLRACFWLPIRGWWG